MNRPAILLGTAAAVVALLAVLALRLGSTDDRTPLPGLSGGATVDAPTASPIALSAPDVPAPAAASHDARRVDERSQPIARDDGPARLERAVAFLRKLLPDRLGNLTAEEARTLTSLDLGGAHLRDGDLAQLAALPALDTVSLRGSDVTDAGLADLRSVANLTAVDLRSTKTTEQGVLALPAERLTALHLTDSAVNARDLRWLPAMPKLQVFKLNGLAMTDAALADLDFLPALRHLELDRTAVTDEGLRRFLEHNPSVQRVELRDTAVTPAAIAELAGSHPGLELVDGRDVPFLPR